MAETTKKATVSHEKEFELKANHLVELKNGLIGAVGCFNGQVAWIVFKAYINVLKKYTKDLKVNGKGEKSSDYDIMRVYDGTDVDNVDNVFKKGFDVHTYPLVWEREKAPLKSASPLS